MSRNIISWLLGCCGVCVVGSAVFFRLMATSGKMYYGIAGGLFITAAMLLYVLARRLYYS